MKFIEKLIYFIFPDLVLGATPWQKIWVNQRQEDFARINRAVLIVISIVYVGHYYFFDKALNLQPPELWLKFRFSMAAISLFCAAYYFFPKLYKVYFYKIPMIIGLSLVCWTQAKVSVWYPEASYLFAVAFTYLASVLLQTSAFKSIIYSLLIYALQSHYFEIAGVPMSMIYSTGVVLLAMTLFSRISYASEIKYFIANLENLEAQRKIIELNLEVANQVKSFLPKEISKRLSDCMSERRMSVVQASDEVLRPKKKTISCIFSDIRGFTQSSKDLDSFVNNGVFPNVKACTEIIDETGGVPRKIGDLIFAYYDNEGVEICVLNALVAGIRISEFNKKYSKLNESIVINRFILISTGEAIVGNLGGFDSSIEITAIGSPINYLSRVDSLTKAEELKQHIKQEDIILDTNTRDILTKLIRGLEINEINIKKLNLTIRDFEAVEVVFVLPFNEKNKSLINSFYNYVESTSRSAA